MTLTDALTALLDEYHLDEWIDVIRDDAKYDQAWDGLSQDHPRVKRFVEVCATVRLAQQAMKAEVEGA